MKRLAPLIALMVSACSGEPQDNVAVRDPTAADAVLPAQGPKSQPAQVVPLPKDQAELDRMILAGFTPHADHLHAPGVKSCPLAKEGNEAVM